MPVRLFYIDDSGAQDTGFVTYSWVEVNIDDWRAGLREWLDWRKQLADAPTHIPVLTELHAAQFIGGRGTPSLDPGWNTSKARRSAVAEEALQVVASSSSLSVGTVYRQTSARRRAYSTQRAAVYAKLVHMLDVRLTASGDLGILIMDGDGSDPSYTSVHRNLKLATRAIIEDPLFQHSHISQWVQIADLVAWSTYQHLLRHPGKQFTWPWYDRYLRGSDVLGSPFAV